MTNSDNGPMLPIELAKWLPPSVFRLITPWGKFRSRHGATTIYWSSHRPMKVVNVLLPDGTRGDTEWSFDSGTQRRKLEDGSFEHGVLKEEGKELKFVPMSSNPTVFLNDKEQRLFEVLKADQPFMADVERVEFAHALYLVIVNDDLGPGERSAARLIVALRDKGEHYMDFAYGGRSEESERARVRGHLKRLGISRRSEV